MKELLKLISLLEKNENRYPLICTNLSSEDKDNYSNLLNTHNIYGHWINFTDRDEFVLDNDLCEISEIKNPILICNLKNV